MRRICTIGHSTLPIGEFIELLRDAGVDTLVDIRSFPGSRHSPQYGQAALRDALADAGIAYVHLPALGGRRRAIVAGSGNEGWREPSFRSYADYTASPEWQEGLERLEQIATASPSAIMCAERTHLRCHRRIVSDNLKARGWDVLHITSRGIEPHVYTEHARIEDGRVTYPAPA